MRISVDRQRCEGHGLCEDVAPELFHLDDDGELVARFDGVDLPVDQSEPARSAVRICPIAALTLDPR